MMFGIGDAMDAAKLMTLGAGNVVSVPASLHHYAMAKTNAIIRSAASVPTRLRSLKKCKS